MARLTILLHKNLMQISLRKRILIVMLLFSIVSAIFLGSITYFAISSILENKLQSAIKSNLSQVRLALENAIGDLNNASQLLSEQGDVGQDLTAFNEADTSFERSSFMSEITSGINLITFTNPSIGMCAYYPVNNELGYISNSRFKKLLPPEGLPLLAKYYKISYYGPHVSRDRFSNQIVLSAIRKMNNPDSSDVFIYIETGFKLTQKILESDMLSQGISHIMTDNAGKIVYSENHNFVLGDTLNISKSESGQVSGYRWYKASSNQGWSMLSVVSDADYNREKNRWAGQYSLFVLLLLLFSLGCGFLLWKTVYRPLQRFNEDIKVVESGDLDTPPQRIGIPEFDHVVESLNGMKVQIKELISEVDRKEKLRADLEIEKLRLQINPHFLMNSLNMAHWLAIAKGQSEIDRVIQSLNKLLAYNLGKSGTAATLRDELEVLDEYMQLQQMRHNIRYRVVNHVGEEALGVVMPRFILQPVIENSVRHGINEAPQIILGISMDENRLLISVSDNGPGMEQEKADRMINGEENHGLPMIGIGISYVKRMLESYYDGAADLLIESGVGKGLTFRIYIPLGEVQH